MLDSSVVPLNNFPSAAGEERRAFERREILRIGGMGGIDMDYKL